jgi:hypothetical protein
VARWCTCGRHRRWLPAPENRVEVWLGGLRHPHLDRHRKGSCPRVVAPPRNYEERKASRRKFRELFSSLGAAKNGTFGTAFPLEPLEAAGLVGGSTVVLGLSKRAYSSTPRTKLTRFRQRRRFRRDVHDHFGQRAPRHAAPSASNPAMLDAIGQVNHALVASIFALAQAHAGSPTL